MKLTEASQTLIECLIDQNMAKALDNNQSADERDKAFSLVSILEWELERRELTDENLR